MLRGRTRIRGLLLLLLTFEWCFSSVPSSFIQDVSYIPDATPKIEFTDQLDVDMKVEKLSNHPTSPLKELEFAYRLHNFSPEDGGISLFINDQLIREVEDVAVEGSVVFTPFPGMTTIELVLTDLEGIPLEPLASVSHSMYVIAISKSDAEAIAEMDSTAAEHSHITVSAPPMGASPPIYLPHVAIPIAWTVHNFDMPSEGCVQVIVEGVHGLAVVFEECSSPEGTFSLEDGLAVGYYRVRLRFVDADKTAIANSDVVREFFVDDFGLAATLAVPTSNYGLPIHPNRTIHIGFTLFESNDNSLLTVALKSVLANRQAHRLHLHFLVDDEGQNQVLALLGDRQFAGVDMSFHDIYNHLPDANTLSFHQPNNARWGYLQYSALAIHKHLPEDAEFIFLIDLDIMFVSGYTSLLRCLDSFGEEQFIGIVREFCCPKGRKQTQDMDWNTGAILLDLRKMRDVGWDDVWMESVKSQFNETNPILIAEQSVYGAVLRDHPEYYFPLPLGLNWQTAHPTDVVRGRVNPVMVHFNGGSRRLEQRLRSAGTESWMRRAFTMYLNMPWELLL